MRETIKLLFFVNILPKKFILRWKLYYNTFVDVYWLESVFSPKNCILMMETKHLLMFFG